MDPETRGCGEVTQGPTGRQASLREESREALAGPG